MRLAAIVVRVRRVPVPEKMDCQASGDLPEHEDQQWKTHCRLGDEARERNPIVGVQERVRLEHRKANQPNPAERHPRERRSTLAHFHLSSDATTSATIASTTTAPATHKP